MATHTFGLTNVKTNEEYAAELFELVGIAFPYTLTTRDGKVLAFSFETEWKEGGTTPIEIPTDEQDEEGKQIIKTEYREDYTERQLDERQIAQLEKWAAANVVTE